MAYIMYLLSLLEALTKFVLKLSSLELDRFGKNSLGGFNGSELQMSIYLTRLLGKLNEIINESV